MIRDACPGLETKKSDVIVDIFLTHSNYVKLFNMFHLVLFFNVYTKQISIGFLKYATLHLS